MNERIRQLAEQAREYATTRHPVSNITLSVNSDLFEQKFAELIVRECIWALWTEECRTSDLASEEYTCGSNKIKEHFGVEK
jgi:hypothetical protein